MKPSTLLVPAALALALGAPAAHAHPASPNTVAFPAPSGLAKVTAIPNPFRAGIEIGAALGAATLWYVLDDRNVFDWDKPAFEQRLTGEAWRFDNNTFGINYIAHPLNGAGMYVLSRGNYLGPWASLGMTTLGSTFWEYVIEFQEKVSINDMLVTPAVGLVFGEFYHRLAMLASAATRRNFADSALAWSLGLSVSAHRAMDGLPERVPASEVDPHQFELSYGFGLSSSRELGPARATHHLRFEGAFTPVAARQEWFGNLDIATLKVELETGPDRVGGTVFGQTMLAGFRAEDGRRRLSVGAMASYLYRKTRGFGYDDRQGLLGLLGPGIFASTYGEHSQLRAQLTAEPTFGSVNSFAFPLWKVSHPGEKTHTVLERNGYSYLWGGAAGLSLEWLSEYARVRIESRLVALDSIDGLDRSPELVRLPSHLTEQSFEALGSFWFRSIHPAWFHGLSLEYRGRRSTIQSGAIAPVVQEMSGMRVLAQTAATF